MWCDVICYIYPDGRPGLDFGRPPFAAHLRFLQTGRCSQTFGNILQALGQGCNLLTRWVESATSSVLQSAISQFWSLESLLQRASCDGASAVYLQEQGVSGPLGCSRASVMTADAAPRRRRASGHHAGPCDWEPHDMHCSTPVCRRRCQTAPALSGDLSWTK